MPSRNRLRWTRGKRSDRPAAAGALALATILQDSLAHSLLFLTGSETPVTVAPVEADTFGQELLERNGVTALEYFRGQSAPEGFLLLPPDTCAELDRRFAAFHAETFEHDTARRLHVLDQLSARLYQLFTLTPRAEEDTPADDQGGWIVKDYRGTDEIRALVWRAASCTVLHAVSGPLDLYFLTDADLHAQLVRRLAQPDLRARYATAILEKYDPQVDPVDPPRDLTIRIQTPQEFVLADLFLPRQIQSPCGWTARAERLSLPRRLQDRLPARLLALRAGIRLDGRDREVHLVFDRSDPKSPPMDRRTHQHDLFRALLHHLRRAFGSLLQADLRVTEISISDRIALPDTATPTLIEYAACWENATTPVMAIIPDDLLRALAERLFAPWEIELYLHNRRNLLLSVLSLNTSLLKSDFPRFLQSIAKNAPLLDAPDHARPLLLRPAPLSQDAIPYEPPRDPAYMLFYQFLRLLPARDAERVLQTNIALGCRLEFTSGFYHGLVPCPEREANGAFFVVPLADFQEQAFLHSIPAPWRERVRAGMGVYGLPLAKFVEANACAMAHLYRTLRKDRLVLSARAEMLLADSFLEPYQQAFREECAPLTQTIEAHCAAWDPALRHALLAEFHRSHRQPWFTLGAYGNHAFIRAMHDILPRIPREDFAYALARTEAALHEGRRFWAEIVLAKQKLLTRMQQCAAAFPEAPLRAHRQAG